MEDWISSTTPEKQKCAICLEDLFSAHSSRVGAVVPCGHCLHRDCFRQWQESAYNRRISNTSTTALVTKCPMCNIPADTFVPLFVDAMSTNPAPTTTTRESLQYPKLYSCGDVNEEAIETFPMAELVANQERIKNKLKKYKRQNKSLKHELQTERHEMEEMLVSTIQNFYKIMDKHEEERKRWCKGALDLRKELDHAREDQLRERREWILRQQLMQQELETLKNDCLRANQRVQSATEGLAGLKIHHARRQSKLQVVLQEKAKLVQENRQLKKAVLATQGPIRSESLY